MLSFSEVAPTQTEIFRAASFIYVKNIKFYALIFLFRTVKKS